MKKTIRILAVFMIIAMLSVSFVSCSNMITGKYRANFFGVETTFEFDMFGKVTKTTFIPKTIFTEEETIVKEGKYEIMEDNDDPSKLVIAFEFDGEERVTYSFSQGEMDGEKIIKISNIEFKKVK